MEKLICDSMKVEFHNQNEVFNKIIKNPIPTRAYIEPEKRKHVNWLRPVATFCTLALIIGLVGYIGLDKLMPTSDSMNNSNKMTETATLQYDNYFTKGYSYSLNANSGYRGVHSDEQEYVDYGNEPADKTSDFSLPYITEGYKRMGYKEDPKGFEIEYKNENGNFILITNINPLNMQPLLISEINGETICIIADAITKEEAEKILYSLVDN